MLIIVRVWNLESRTLCGQCLAEGWISSLCLSPDAALLVVGTGGGTYAWDIASGAKSQLVSPDHDAIWACVFSPDGKWIATSGSDNSIKTWDATNKHEQMTLLGHSGRIVALAFSPDGTTLVGGGVNGELKLWDLTTGQELFELSGHTGGVEHVAFSRDGQMLATSGSSRTGKGEVWLWFAPRPGDKENTIGQPH